MQEKLRIRKELRNVQHQLSKDIEQLGTQLKLNQYPGGAIIADFAGAWVQGFQEKTQLTDRSDQKKPAHSSFFLLFCLAGRK